MMPLLRCLVTILLATIVVTGAPALAQGLQHHDAGPGRAHAAVSQEDRGGPRHGHGAECETCDPALAGPCMMSLCHPDLIAEGIRLTAPAPLRRWSPATIRARTGTVTEVVPPPPRRLL